MHELSIASSILELARRHVPGGSCLRSLKLTAGPMRAIEPEAMQFAWQAILQEAGADEISLELNQLPWQLRCASCGREWQSESTDCICVCGSDRVSPVGGDELQITSIEVDDIVEGVPS
ncbi:hydrogenase maturation nickel metallochaperone HypA [soil metagenome]